METDRSPLNSTHVQGNAAELQNSYPTAWSGRGDATEGGFDPASPDIRVILEQLNNGPTEGGYGAGICFELSAHRSVGVGATIDPATGSLPGHRGRWKSCVSSSTNAARCSRPSSGTSSSPRPWHYRKSTPTSTGGGQKPSPPRRCSRQCKAQGTCHLRMSVGEPGGPPVHGPKMVTSSTEPAPRRAGSQR